MWSDIELQHTENLHLFPIQSFLFMPLTRSDIANVDVYPQKISRSRRQALVHRPLDRMWCPDSLLWGAIGHDWTVSGWAEANSATLVRHMRSSSKMCRSALVRWIVTVEYCDLIWFGVICLALRGLSVIRWGWEGWQEQDELRDMLWAWDFEGDARVCQQQRPLLGSDRLPVAQLHSGLSND